MRSFCFALVVVSALVAPALATKAHTKFSANPVRRVVNMLVMMQKKVETEGEKQDELFEKFLCYCKTTQANLGKSIQDANEKIPQLESSIKGSEEARAQLQSELASHKEDRTEAQDAVAKATAAREKEAKSFASESADQKTNIAALGKAIPAIEKGMGSDFLQTGTAQQLRTLVSLQSNSAAESLSGSDRELLSDFLSGSEDQSGGSSSEILGILKQMKEEMEKDLSEMESDEAAAISEFQALVAAKEKEIAAATAAIEDKTKRIGDVSVELANLKEDLDDTSAGLASDSKLLADSVKACDAKTKAHELAAKTRGEELLAISDTIKMLNDDDALDLFKKTLPSPSASFLDVGESSTELRQQALQVLRSNRRKGGDYRVNFLALAMQGKKVGFDKVLAMIDGMVELLGKEGTDDDKKKAYCEKEFDKSDDEIKALTSTIADLGSAIDEQKESAGSITEEEKTLRDGIVELDRDVAEATAQRKEEHADFTETLASNNAAIQLIEMAKNRMNKFYAPELYKAAPKRQLSEEERITLNMGGTLAPTNPPGGIAGTGISFMGLSFAQIRTEAGSAKEEANGVIAMMDMLKTDVKKEVQEMEFEEKAAQSDYEEMVNAAAEKRTTDSKALQEKQAALAGKEEELHKLTTEQKSRADELMDAKKMLHELHEDCDWLLQNYQTRKEARANEIDAMTKAKAVLSGADFSFIQMRVTHHLRHR